MGLQSVLGHIFAIAVETISLIYLLPFIVHAAKSFATIVETVS
jgi:hypothetical protein